MAERIKMRWHKQVMLPETKTVPRAVAAINEAVKVLQAQGATEFEFHWIKKEQRMCIHASKLE